MKKLFARIVNLKPVRLARQAADKHRLTFALGIAVVASLSLVGVSVSLYYATGFYRYDLSRPGYERERAEISKPEPVKTYDTTSPVSKSTVDDFLTEYDGRLNDLKTFSDFRDTSLSDEDLQIAPPAN